MCAIILHPASVVSEDVCACVGLNSVRGSVISESSQCPVVLPVLHIWLAAVSSTHATSSPDGPPSSTPDTHLPNGSDYAYHAPVFLGHSLLGVTEDMHQHKGLCCKQLTDAPLPLFLLLIETVLE
jgi:hypothetical protein